MAGTSLSYKYRVEDSPCDMKNQKPIALKAECLREVLPCQVDLEANPEGRNKQLQMHDVHIRG